MSADPYHHANWEKLWLKNSRDRLRFVKRITNLKAMDPLGSDALLTEMGHWLWIHVYNLALNSPYFCLLLCHHTKSLI